MSGAKQSFRLKRWACFSGFLSAFCVTVAFAQDPSPVKTDRFIPPPKQMRALAGGSGGGSAVQQPVLPDLSHTRELPANTSLDTSLPAQSVLATTALPSDAYEPPVVPVSLQKSARIERLRKILGADLLQLPEPAAKGPLFSAKIIERFGIEDAAAASISQSYQLAAAEAREGYAEAMTGVARASLLPQAKFTAKQGRETTSPGGDTYKFCKSSSGCKDASGAVRYQLGEKVPSSGALNGGVKASDLTDSAFAQDSVTVPNRRELQLSVSQVLFDYANWAENFRQYRVYESSRHAAQAIRMKAVLDSTSSYMRLFQNSLALRFAEDYEQALQILYERIEERVAAGASSQADQERVKGRRVNARSTVLDAKNALEVELTSFQKLTGFRPRLLALPPDWILPMPENIDGAVVAASENNPALLADLKQAESFLSELHKVKGAFLPVIGIEATETRSRGSGGSLAPIVTAEGAVTSTLTSSSPTYLGQENHFQKKIQSLMLTLNWSLFSGGADYYQHRAVAEKYNEAMFRLLDTRRELEEKLRSSFSSLATTTARTQEIAKEMESNQQVVESFTEQMFAANRSLLDVLDAHQKLYQSRLDYLRLLIAEGNLAFDVLYNIGTLTEVLKVPGDAQSPRGRMGSLVGQDVWRKQ